MEGILGMGKLALGVADDGIWLPCDGRMLSNKDYPELFALIGDRFGSMGPDYFALPKADPQPAGQFFIMVRNKAEESWEKRGLVSQFALWPLEEMPNGWLPCDGRTVNSADWPLFSELAFQGQGGVLPSFELPNIPENGGMKFIICVEGRDPRAEM